MSETNTYRPHLKYCDYAVVFQEVPSETSQAIDITNCPHACKNCHSPHLRSDIGRELLPSLSSLMDMYDGQITCVCFMGEGRNPYELRLALQMVKERGLNTCVYAGYFSKYDAELYEEYLDYLKVGGYEEALGGLNSPITNQRFYKVQHVDHCAIYHDITSVFQGKKDILSHAHDQKP